MTFTDDHTMECLGGTNLMFGSQRDISHVGVNTDAAEKYEVILIVCLVFVLFVLQILGNLTFGKG